MDQRFSAHVISGSGRGKVIGTPTINLDLSDIPADLGEGIYACFAKISGEWLQAAVHYGPRPVFKDSKTFEVYLLDTTDPDVSDELEVAVIGRLRGVLDFPSTDALLAQIGQDVEQSRAMLDAHGIPQS